MDRIIIDVREPLEFKMGHVKGAINIPPSQMMAGANILDDVPKDTELVLYCVSGSRSNFRHWWGPSISTLKEMLFSYFRVLC